jgi:hypothetical protein
MSLTFEPTAHRRRAPSVFQFCALHEADASGLVGVLVAVGACLICVKGTADIGKRPA